MGVVTVGWEERLGGVGKGGIEFGGGKTGELEVVSEELGKGKGRGRIGVAEIGLEGRVEKVKVVFGKSVMEVGGGRVEKVEG